MHWEPGRRRRLSSNAQWARRQQAGRDPSRRARLSLQPRVAEACGRVFQRLKLDWTKEIADAGFVKGVLIEFDRHATSIMSAIRLMVPTFYKGARKRSIWAAGRISLLALFGRQNRLESRERRTGRGFSKHPNYLRFDVLQRARREVVIEAYLVADNSNVSVLGVLFGLVYALCRRDGA